MAKTRIHELAKELQITSRELIDKVESLGIPVKNHMSTLEEEDVGRLRTIFSDSSDTVVQEKRIGRRVIRRRKLKVEKKEEEIPSVSPGAEAAAPTDTALEKPLEPEPSVTAEDVIQHELKKTPQEVVKPEPLEEEIPEPTKTADKTAKEIKAAESEAVALPEEEPPEGMKVVDRVTESPETLEEKPAEEAVSLVRRKRLEGEAEAEVKVKEEEKEEPVVAKKKVSEKARVVAKKKPSKRIRKKKKEEAAVIISLPEEPVEPEKEVAKKQQLPIDIEEARRAKGKKEPRKEAPERKAVSPKKKKAAKVRPLPVPETKPRRPEKRKVVSKEDLYTKEELKTQRLMKSRRGARAVRADKDFQKPEITVPKAIKRRIKIDEAITVANLAKRMGIAASEVIKKLMEMGLMVSVNQSIDFDTASLVADEFEFQVEKAAFEEEEILTVAEDRDEDLKPRSPVVTIMGHVDHGKTSLLDVIRHTNVTEGEAGGITQHIGAYQVKVDGGQVTFLDTPGHEAFTSMRARGAQVTDLVVLVVAADDGVMQQTIEAINHARAANIPILVAINKIDKPDANPDRVKRELAEHGLIPEEWGGDTTMVEVSAKKKVGIEDLLEMILLQAELLELKANPDKPARGRIIEARLDRGRGPVATVLVQEGTLSVGDFFVCGVHHGKVRALFDSNRRRILKATPSVPVEIQGISGVPDAGDDFVVVPNEKQAKMISEHRKRKQRETELSRTTKVTLEKLYDHIREGEIKELNIILKTDVHGTLEAITDSLQKLSTDEIRVNIIHSATGGISETDVMLASASNAVIIGFNVRADMKVLEVAEREQVDIRFYDVIYQLIADVRDALEGMLEPEYKEVVTGRAEVRQTFNIPKIGTVAGCYVSDGRIERGSKVHVVRDGIVVYQGKISSLKRFKEDVREVKAGYECGIGIENYNDIKVDDMLEAFILEEIKPSLDMDKKEE